MFDLFIYLIIASSETEKDGESEIFSKKQKKVLFSYGTHISMDGSYLPLISNSLENI